MHETIGRDREIALGISRGCTDAPLVRECGRQGDLIVRRVGDATSGSQTPAALLLAAGKHGEHWVVTTSGGAQRGDEIDLPDGGMVVHTDQPSARHGALRLASGRWECLREQELSTEGVVIRVAD
jgi:hypothetical protein